MERGYVIVTSSRTGLASLFVDLTRRDSSARNHLLAVVVCDGGRPGGSGWSHLRRRMAKVRRIGVLGALNGLYMRRWYGSEIGERLGCRDLFECCAAAGVPVVRIEGFWDPAAQRALADLEPDLGVSLGNGFIPEEFFRIPRWGMINVHHELLPDYRGAQTAIWQIHDGSRLTGFTIHEVTKRIDQGRILLRESMPIAFGANLHETVVSTGAQVQRRSLERLMDLLGDYQRYRDAAVPNEGGRLHTTPSGRAVLRIYRNHARLLRASS